MSTLKVYEMKVETKEINKVESKIELTDSLPDDSNLVVVNGVLMLVDAFNDSSYSISDILDTLDDLSEKMFIGQHGANILTAIHNFFDQVKEEYQ